MWHTLAYGCVKDTLLHKENGRDRDEAHKDLCFEQYTSCINI